MMDYQTMAERMDTTTASDLGLTPLAPDYTAPDWLLMDVVTDAPVYDAVTCCDSYAVEWQLRAGPDAEYVLAMERAQVLLLQTEIDRRKAHDLAKSAVAQAAETEVRIKDREREIEIVRNQYHIEREAKEELREGTAMLRAMFNGYGYGTGSLTERLEAMYKDLVALRKASAQSGAHFRPEPPDDEAA
jgi:hypothetical protein